MRYSVNINFSANSLQQIHNNLREVIEELDGQVNADTQEIDVNMEGMNYELTLEE